MERWLAGQTVIFAWGLVLGLLLGLIYDVLACARRAAGGRGLAQGVCDLVFCAVALLLFLLFLLTIGHGELRSYILFGIGLGACAYALALSRPVRAVLMPIFRLARRGVGRCRRGIVRIFSPPRGN